MAISSISLNGFNRTPAAHSQTSINAAVSGNQIHKGKPATVAQEATAKTAKEELARTTAQRQAAQTSVPTTSYNAQGKIHAVEQAQTGRRFHAEA